MQGHRISHYEIVRLLGRGGMGEVWEAADLHLDRRPVALKFIAPELAAEPESLARFEREAVSAAKLRHPHIATVYVFHREGPRPFIAMELLSGPSLRERVRQGPLPLGEALVVTRQVAEALAHAHRRGVIHRDIKPENLMFDDDGSVKVMDFGLARAAQQSRLTMTGTTMGTAGYMAPETMRGAPGAPADVFALGVVLFELLTGELPFAGDNPMSLLFTIAHDPPRPLRALRPDAPEALEALVARALDKDPARRPDAAALARELAILAGEAPPRLEPVTEEHPVEPLARRPSAVRAVSPAGAASGAVTVPVPLAAAAGGGAAAAPQGTAALAVPGRERALQAAGRPPRRGAAAVLGAGLAVAVLAAGGLLAWRVVLPARRAEARRAAVALNNRGFERLAAGDIAGARQDFERALARDADYAEAKLNLGLLLRREGERDEAARLFGEVQRAAGDGPLAAKALYNLAELDLDAGAWSEAARSLERAAAMDTTIADYAGNLLFALVRAGRHPEAIAAGERALARWPGDPGLSKNLGYALVLAGRPADALPHLDRAVAGLEFPGPAHGVRALAHAALGAAAPAAADWSAYLASAPPAGERAILAREFAARGGRP